MPRRDGTGPMHTGPMNGRDLGSCTGKNTVKNDAGFGLGLAQAMKIAQLYGGGIKVDSRKNEGSSFTFFIPTTEKK